MAKPTKKQIDKLTNLADKLTAKIGALSISGKQPKLKAALEGKLQKIEGKLGNPLSNNSQQVLAGNSVPVDPGLIPNEFPGAQAAFEKANASTPALAGGMTSYPTEPTMASFFDKVIGTAAPAIAKSIPQIAGGGNVFDTLGGNLGDALGGLNLGSVDVGGGGGYGGGAPVPAGPVGSSIPTWFWIGGGLVVAYILWKALKK